MKSYFMTINKYIFVYFIIKCSQAYYNQSINKTQLNLHKVLHYLLTVWNWRYASHTMIVTVVIIRRQNGRLFTIHRLFSCR